MEVPFTNIVMLFDIATLLFLLTKWKKNQVVYFLVFILGLITAISFIIDLFESFGPYGFVGVLLSVIMAIFGLGHLVWDEE